MQKKIIALAVAGLASTAVFAQSNVSVYGVADVYGAGINYAGQHTSAINSSGAAGSRLGFKGEEDLGGGNKALFTLEYALATDGDVAFAAASSARQQFVGLTGGMGTVIAGRLQTLVYSHNAAYNPTFGMTVDTNASVGGGAGMAVLTAERLNNAVAYVSPKIGGVTLGLAHTRNAAATEAGTTNANTIASEASAKYDNGPLSLGTVYRTAPTTGAYAIKSEGNSSYAVGGAYDFGVAKLMANYATQIDNGGADTSRLKSVNVGAVVPVSAKGALVLSRTKADNKSDGDWITTAVVYKHSLSARTSLYAGVAEATASGLASATQANTATLAGITSYNGVTGAAGGVGSAANPNIAAALVGINHSF